METKIKNETLTLENKNTTLFEKITAIRSDFLKMKIKKSGENKYSGFKYYELGDIIPAITALEEKYGVFSVISFTETDAYILIRDAENYSSENETSYVNMSCPLRISSVKGANDAQNFGATMTYYRRYLLMLAYQIVENDSFDMSLGENQKKEDELKETKTKIIGLCKQAADKEKLIAKLEELGLEGGNPNKIKDIETAQKVLSEIQIFVKDGTAPASKKVRPKTDAKSEAKISNE